MTMLPWDRWLIKDFGNRGVRRLLETIEELLSRKPVVSIAHVEDDSVDAILIRNALCQRAWRITVFSSYDEAFESLVEGDPSKFDCVLSDIMLPAGWEGLRLAARLKKKAPELPIIMYTNRAEPDPATAYEILSEPQAA